MNRNTAMRATAFVTRSIRQDSRTISHHVMRAAVALFILFIFATQIIDTRMTVGVGAQFSWWVFVCCYWFLTLLGGVHFSAAISEERDEQTLPLLKMTGASPASILLGKSLPRLAVALLFLLCIAPFLLLAITLGGVLTSGLVSTILSFLCYSLMLSQIGLLASVLGSDTRRAFGWMVFFWSLAELLSLWMSVPWAAGLISDVDYGGARIETMSWSFIQNLGGTLLAFSAQELWRTHMTVHLIVSALAFLISLLLFNRFTEEKAGGRGSMLAAELLGSGHTSRAWDRALEWKSWHQLGGGFRWMWIRAFGGIAISAGLVLFIMLMFETFEWEGFGLGTFWVAVVVFLLSVGRLLGRVFQFEIQENTLANLVMLPQSNATTFTSMLVGLLPVILASFVPVVVGFVLMMYTIMQFSYAPNLWNLMEITLEPWFWHTFSWAFVTYCLTINLSTKVRHGAFLIAIGLNWFIFPMFFGFGLGILGLIGIDGGFEFVRFVIPMGLIVAEVLVSVGLIRTTFAHLEMLAAK